MVLQLVSATAGLTNGDFSNGLAFFRQSGGGSASVLTAYGSPLLDLATGPSDTQVTLTQLVNTKGGTQRLQLDYQFLTAGGTLQVLLNETELLHLTANGAISAFGSPALQSLGEFTRVSLDLSDPALLGLEAADFNLRLLPGSPAEAQVDNLQFGPTPFKIDSITHAGDQINLRWQGGVGPYQVQRRISLSSGAWEDFGSANSGREVTLPVAEGNAFYRITDLGSN